MRNCPECAEENVHDKLFCENCGHCLLSPDPEVAPRSISMNIELVETAERIDYFDVQSIKKSGDVLLKRKHQMVPAGSGGWILVLNLIVFVLMAQVALYIVGR